MAEMLPFMIQQSANEAAQSINQIVASSLNYVLEQKEEKEQAEETFAALHLKEKQEEDADNDRLSKMMLQSQYAKHALALKEYNESLQGALQARQQNILNHYLQAKYEGGKYKKENDHLLKKLSSQVVTERNF